MIKETKAPKGYVISNELRKGILVELGSEEITKYTLTNKKFVGKVVLTKTDATSRERLEHAVSLYWIKTNRLFLNIKN